MSFVPDRYFRKRGITSVYDNGRGVIILPGRNATPFYSPAARQAEIDASVAAALADPSYFDVAMDPSNISDTFDDSADIYEALNRKLGVMSVRSRAPSYKPYIRPLVRPGKRRLGAVSGALDPSSVAKVRRLNPSLKPKYILRRRRVGATVPAGYVPVSRRRFSLRSARLLTKKPVFVVRRKKPLTSLQRSRSSSATYYRRALASVGSGTPVSGRYVIRRRSRYV